MAQRRNKAPAFELGGSLWITAGGESLGGHGRMALLRAVEEHGSITQAARAFGMSYKAAWGAIDTMNRVAGGALVERITGGAGGGSTRLTERGRRLLQRHGQLDAVHQRFVQLLSASVLDLDRDFSLLEVLNMKTTARNQFVGTVTAVRSGAVNDQIEVKLAPGKTLVAIITRESTEALALRTNQTVIVLIKASSVLVATGLEGGAKVSARNQLSGVVSRVTPGAVNAEITIDAGDGVQVVATITQSAVAELGLAPGARATALVKASDVILAVVT